MIDGTESVDTSVEETETTEDSSEGGEDAGSTPSFEEWKAGKERLAKSDETKSEKKEEPKSEKKPTKSEEKEDEGKEEDNDDSSSNSDSSDKEDKADKKDKSDEKYTLKVNNVEKEYTHAEMLKLAQLGAAADDKFQTAAKLNKEAKSILESFKTDFKSAIDSAKIPRETIEKWYYEEFIEPDLLTPEEKAAKAKDKELEELRAFRKAEEERIQRQKEEDEAKEKERTHKEEVQQLIKQIHGVVVEAGLPQTKWVISRVAANMKEHGTDNPADVVKFVKEEILEAQKALLPKMSVDEIKEAFGNEVFNNIRKSQVEKFKNGKLKISPKAGKVRTSSNRPNAAKKYSNPYDMIDS